MTRQDAHPGTGTSSRRVAPPRRAPAGQIQSGTRVCRWPARDLLTGAPLEPDADVRAVTDFEWRGAVQTRERPTEYGVASLPGLARMLQDWPARHAAIAAAQAAAAAAAEDEMADGAEADEASA